MSPTPLIIPSPEPRWWADWHWPMRPGTPTDGVGGSGFTATSSLGWHTGSASTAAPVPQIQQATSAAGTGGVDRETLHRVLGGRWCVRLRSLSAVGVTNALLWRTPWYTPQLDRVAGAGLDDDAMRIGWLQAFLFTRAGGPGAPDDDRVGIGFVADDGSRANAMGPADVGGFGIFQRAGTQDWRLAIYDAAPVLLEAIDLAAAPGWHVADFIMRQARRGDVTTPWLTVRWDGVTIVEERVFGSGLLPAASSYLPLAHSWGIVGGARGLSGTPWECTLAWRWRQGPFHPVGYPII